jgi:alpha-L-rhamnosidase
LEIKLLYRLAAFYFLLFTFFKVAAQPHIKTNWQAQWIGETTASEPNTFYKYRYQFTTNELPTSVIASIAVDSKYWLWLNGKLVVFEGQLKRGPTPNDSYYDEVDLKPYLQKGSNTICILVWYWGKDGFCHKSSGKAGLLFEVAIGKKNIISNSGWKVAKHLAYGNTTAPHPNFRLPEHNILYDARKDNEDWIQPTYSDLSWTNAVVIDKAGAAPWNKLWKRPIPQWHNSGLSAYKNKINADSNTLVMQLPKNISVTPYFKIEAPAGLLVDIRTDNYNGGSAPNIRTEYITKDGVQEFESPAYFNGYQVIYSFPKGVKVLDVKYRETKYNTTYVGYFNSSNPFLNTLWDKSITTLNVNMRDGIYDSPDRERAQWWGDIVIVLEEIFYSCDKNGMPAIKKAISNLLEWQKEDGALFSPIPAGNWDKELPAQMLAAVSKYGIWKYIEHSGDTAMIRYSYPFIKKYMSLWKLNEKGLVQHRSGGWDWHDWGEKIDVPLLDNAWYYMALEACYNMSKHLKLEEDAANYQQQMQSIKTNFQRYFWKGNRFASDDYTFYADDRGNGLAVCAGLVSNEQWQQLKPMLDTTFHAGPYLEKYILESYFIMNDAAAGLKRMQQRYDAMVNHPTITTLWEGWEIGSSTYGGGTYNHGWTGGPLSLMSGYVAGIRPQELGYAAYLIKPQVAGLSTIHCRTLTAKGFIGVQLYAKVGNMKMNIETIAAKGLIAVPKLSKQAKVLFISSKQLLNYKYQDEAYWYYECSKKGKVQVVTSW